MASEQRWWRTAKNHFTSTIERKGCNPPFVSADLGVFQNGKTSADLQARGSLNYAVNKQLGLTASGGYEGEKFVSGENRPSFAGVFDQRNGARTNAALGINWRADQPIGGLHRVAISTRASVRHEGGVEAKTASTVSASVSAQIGETGPLVSAVVQSGSDDRDGEGVSSNSIRVRALQRFKFGSVTAAYSQSKSEGREDAQQLVATVQTNPVKKVFARGASVQIVPNANLNWDGDQTRANIGASALADSGRLFGQRLNVQSRFSSFSNFTAEDENAQSTRFLGSVQARYRLTKSAELSAIYTDDFNGLSDLSVAVRGSLRFNPPRASRLPEEGRGILNGRVFLDRNRDGIRQASEPGVPGVRVKLIGTRIGLNTSSEGFFTIQNIQQGLYAVTVSRESLPLGYLVPEEAQPRVTVGSGRRSDVEIPLILSGQIRGTVFVDDNASGAVDPGEKRIEGQWIKLTPKAGGESTDIHSAAFGQFGFESVDPGEYIAETVVAGQTVRIELTIDPQNPFVVAQLPIPPDIFEGRGGVDFSAGLLGEP